MILVAAPIAWIGYRSYAAKVVDANAEANSKFEKYRWGNAPPLSGPYSKEGNPKDLMFETVDLGIGHIMTVSENGDILYKWYGDAPVTFPYKDNDGFARTGIRLGEPILRLRKSDSSIHVYPKALDVVLTRGGKVYEINGTQNAYTVVHDGKTIFDSTKTHDSKYAHESWQNGSTVTDDGIFPGFGSNSRYLFTKESKVVSAEPVRGDGYGIKSGSSNLGTFGTIWYDGSDGQKPFGYRMTHVYDGKFETIQFPEQIQQPMLKGTKDSVIAYGLITSPVRPYEYRNKIFTAIAIPPGVASLDILGANSQGDYLMKLDKVSPECRGKYAFPYTHQFVYQSHGTFYEMSEIFRNLNIAKETELSGGNLMDEDGDLVLSRYGPDYDRIVILRRVR